MTSEEIMKLPQGEFLRYLIRNTEERFISYGKMLEDQFKEKLLPKRIAELDQLLTDGKCTKEEYDIEKKTAIDNDIWFKSHLRDCRNDEGKRLKELRDEQQYYNQGMNPPFLYPNYKKNQE